MTAVASRSTFSETRSSRFSQTTPRMKLSTTVRNASRASTTVAAAPFGSAPRTLPSEKMKPRHASPTGAGKSTMRRTSLTASVSWLATRSLRAKAISVMGVIKLPATEKTFSFFGAAMTGLKSPTLSPSSTALAAVLPGASPAPARRAAWITTYIRFAASDQSSGGSKNSTLDLARTDAQSATAAPAAALSSSWLTLKMEVAGVS